MALNLSTLYRATWDEGVLYVNGRAVLEMASTANPGEAELFGSAAALAQELVALLGKDGHTEACSWNRLGAIADVPCREDCERIRRTLSNAGVALP